MPKMFVSKLCAKVGSGIQPEIHRQNVCVMALSGPERRCRILVESHDMNERSSYIHSSSTTRMYGKCLDSLTKDRNGIVIVAGVGIGL
jgi:hypothetical protein